MGAGVRWNHKANNDHNAGTHDSIDARELPINIVGADRGVEQPVGLGAEGNANMLPIALVTQPQALEPSLFRPAAPRRHNTADGNFLCLVHRVWANRSVFYDKVDEAVGGVVSVAPGRVAVGVGHACLDGANGAFGRWIKRCWLRVMRVTDEVGAAHCVLLVEKDCKRRRRRSDWESGRQ